MSSIGPRTLRNFKLNSPYVTYHLGIQDKMCDHQSMELFDPTFSCPKLLYELINRILLGTQEKEDREREHVKKKKKNPPKVNGGGGRRPFL